MLEALEQGVKGGVWFSLIDKVIRVKTLRTAWSRVKANRGSAGTDHQSLEEFEGRLGENLEKLHVELKSGTYHPRPIKRVWIDQPGSQEKRPLGIPAVRDRVVESALRLVEEALAKIALTSDLLTRNQGLFERKSIAEYDYTKVKLQLAYEQKLLATARREAALRQTDLDRLTLKSPIAGVVYKLDVRLGELLTPEDYRRIIIGKKEKQVRLFVEVFWRERYRLGHRVIIKDAETLQEIGVGNVAAILPYIGTRDFRTEEPLERLDTKYNQVIVELRTSREIPIGLQVIGFSED